MGRRVRYKCVAQLRLAWCCCMPPSPCTVCFWRAAGAALLLRLLIDLLQLLADTNARLQVFAYAAIGAAHFSDVKLPISVRAAVDTFLKA